MANASYAPLSGLGTTQILMRIFYVPMVAPGVAPQPVIDAWSTVMILGFVLVRLLVAAPFLPTILAEIRRGPAPDGAAIAGDDPTP